MSTANTMTRPMQSEPAALETTTPLVCDTPAVRPISQIIRRRVMAQLPLRRTKDGGVVIRSTWLNGQYRKIGFMVAYKDGDGVVRIGWSKYNAVSERRPFDNAQAYMIASGRAERGCSSKVPLTILSDLKRFAKRCEVYFNAKDVRIQGKIEFPKPVVNLTASGTGPTPSDFLGLPKVIK